VILLLALATAKPAHPLDGPSHGYFGVRCVSCHSDDDLTCNGCHHHGAQDLVAEPDKDLYSPGEEVRVTLSGGLQRGWVRARLTGASDVEVARRTGPTFSGNDGGPQIVLPLELVGRAPGTAGDHAWSALYFGAEDGRRHSEIPVDATIRVATTATAVVRAIPSRSPLFFGRGGGVESMEVRLRNTTAAPVEIDAWIELVLPDGAEAGPVYGPMSLLVPGSWEGRRALSLAIPAKAPSGVYSLQVMVGDYTSKELIDADSFAFVKRP